MAGIGDPLLWVGTLVFGAATAYTALGAQENGSATRLAVFPPLVGTLGYVLAALGVGGAAGGLALTRYVDWILTAPLLLGVLALVGRAGGASLWGALGSAAVMGTAGLALGTAGLAGTTKLGALAGLWLAALLALALLFRPLSRQAGTTAAERARLFSMLRNPVLPAFVGYALVVTVSPAGLDVVGPLVASAGLLVFDALGKALIPVVLARNVALLD